ncbi:PiggyBac transposable element-derived protein 4 [Holothuria leucospilota]|uniref:PiggyBac transposable element-derived protein 4 n=1 Tax=Holothuria leucospilota TaxID=206669 RepID=A0A9Q0YUD7_HOLLE|nr:PiggyBac transposable element-derived protein 4 [Holothuria leucospilota]
MLCERLIEENSVVREPRRKGRPSLGENPLRLTARHFPSTIPPTEKKDKPTRRCHVCASRDKREETIYECRECEKPLCAAPCFGIYHTKRDFHTDLE